jgi:signal transduction histidine kinase
VIAVLLYDRYLRTGAPSDVILVIAFGVLALLEAVLPILAEIEPATRTVAFWSRLSGRTLIAIALCIAAWLRGRSDYGRLRPTPVAPHHVLAACATGAGVIVASTALRVSRLPAAVSGDTHDTSALVHSTGVLGARLAGTALLLVAAAGFARRARRSQEEVLEWLAIGAVLLAEARFHDFLFPSMRSDWLTTGDVLRVVAQNVLLWGVLVDVRAAWRGRVTQAAVDARRRVAAELHDGLAQELAFLSTRSAQLARDAGNEAHLAQVAESARRALSEARSAIEGYSVRGRTRLDLEIGSAAREIEMRHELPVVVDADQVELDATVAHELTRVVHEAMWNAARHADARSVAVSLRATGNRLVISVVDDGRGLADPGATDRAGFGLRTMRERAERLGGSCTVATGPGGGTTVTVAVTLR